MSIALMNRVKALEEQPVRDCTDLIMSLEQQIKKLEEKLLAESQFRNADFQLIEKLQKRIDELERKMPKKRGRGRPAKKLSDEDFN